LVSSRWRRSGSRPAWRRQTAARCLWLREGTSPDRLRPDQLVLPRQRLRDRLRDRSGHGLDAAAAQSHRPIPRRGTVQSSVRGLARWIATRLRRDPRRPSQTNPLRWEQELSSLHRWHRRDRGPSGYARSEWRFVARLVARRHEDRLRGDRQPAPGRSPCPGCRLGQVLADHWRERRLRALRCWPGPRVL
jgi:hypothetical protein